jgi:predicted transcriptional regulator
MIQARSIFKPAPAPDPATQATGPLQALVLRLIHEHGLSQGQIGRAIKAPQSRLSRYARGQVPPALDDVFKLQDLERRLVNAKQAAEELTAKALEPQEKAGPGG